MFVLFIRMTISNSGSVLMSIVPSANTFALMYFGVCPQSKRQRAKMMQRQDNNRCLENNGGIIDVRK